MSILRHHSLGNKSKLISFFGFATSCPDNTADGTSPMVVVPPSNMIAGDLVYCSIFCASGGLVTFGTPVTGGQSWNPITDRNSALPAIRSQWCTFNGTWSANPQFSANAGGVAKSVQMFVFRPAKVGAVWAVDQPVSLAVETGTTVTIAGVTNAQNRVVTIARAVISTASQTYSSHSPGSFTNMGGNFRNTSSNNKNALYFYKIQPIGEATGGLAVTISGSATTYKSMHSFYYT